MHYRGLLRVARREAGIRIYEAVEHPPADTSRAARTERAAALLELVLRKYAPLPGTSFRYLTYLLGYGAPHLAKEARTALATAREQLATVRIDRVRLVLARRREPALLALRARRARSSLAPFDPIAWDRRRFELLWGWTYRFEAYTPAAKRKLGYYALPLLWRDRMVGWGNASVTGASAAAADPVRRRHGSRRSCSSASWRTRKHG
jgi:uncharacterized protein YcaQ